MQTDIQDSQAANNSLAETDNPALAKIYHRMISGEEYCCVDPELLRFRAKQQGLNRKANLDPDGHIPPGLLPNLAPSAMICTPFFVSYGINLQLASGVFINTNATLQDNAPITIGANSMLGPNVQCYTATHPLEATPRIAGLETARAIHIGERVWIGGGAIILPGVHIGDEAVVAAGSVVTKDVPAGTLVAGNPARVKRSLK